MFINIYARLYVWIERRRCVYRLAKVKFHFLRLWTLRQSLLSNLGNRESKWNTTASSTWYHFKLRQNHLYIFFFYFFLLIGFAYFTNGLFWFISFNFLFSFKFCYFIDTLFDFISSSWKKKKILPMLNEWIKNQLIRVQTKTIQKSTK